VIEAIDVFSRLIDRATNSRTTSTSAVLAIQRDDKRCVAEHEEESAMKRVGGLPAPREAVGFGGLAVIRKK
jgi:hypothetical protein